MLPILVSLGSDVRRKMGRGLSGVFLVRHGDRCGGSGVATCLHHPGTRTLQPGAQLISQRLQTGASIGPDGVSIPKTRSDVKIVLLCPAIQFKTGGAVRLRLGPEGLLPSGLQAGSA